MGASDLRLIGISLGLSLLLAGCGSSESAIPEAAESVSFPVAPDSQSDFPSGLPVADGPVSALRKASAHAVHITGSAAVATSTDGVLLDMEAQTATLLAGVSQEASWAMYTLPDCATFRPVELRIATEPAAGEEAAPYWVLYSNYSGGRWRMAEGPNEDASFSGTATISLNSVERRERVVGRSQPLAPTFSYIVLHSSSTDRPTPASGLSVSEATILLRDIADPAYWKTAPMPAWISGVEVDQHSGATRLYFVPEMCEGAEELQLERRPAGAPGWDTVATFPATDQSFTLQFPGTQYLNQSFDYRAVAVVNDGTALLRSGYSNQLRAALPPNLQPLAVLAASSSAIRTVDRLSFNAASSTDVDGQIVDYEWDFDGDGAFNEPGAETASRGNQTPLAVRYETTGSFQPGLRVTDDQGGTHIARLSVAVSQSNIVLGFVRRAGDNAGLAGVQLTTSSGAHVQTISNGSYAIADLADGNHTITPHLAGWSFQPTDITLSLDTEIKTAVNFSAYADPVAHLQSSVAYGHPPLVIQFDATASFDPDDGTAPGGGIVRYEWDWDGDGTYDLDSGSNPLVGHYYPRGGEFEVKLRVTDNEGIARTASVQLVLVPRPTFSIRGNIRIANTADSLGYAEIEINGRASVSADSHGRYSVSLQRGTYTIAPRRSGWTFFPASRELLVDRSLSRVDFQAFALPVAKIASDDFAGNAPLVSTFDATGSSDPDGGTIVSYEMDFDGDGIYDQLQPTPVFSHEYQIGEWIAVLRVTDDEGQTSTVAHRVSCNHWSEPIVAGTGPAFHPAAFVLDGLPTVAYAVTAGGVRFARGASPDGGGAWTETMVDPTGRPTRPADVILADGTPALAYFDFNTKEVSFHRSSLSDGSGAWTEKIVSIEQVACSMALLAGGIPAIAFTDSTDLNLAVSDSLSGLDDWELVEIPTTAVVIEKDLFLATVAGRPAITYRQFNYLNEPEMPQNELSLWYASTQDATGMSDWVASRINIDRDIYVLRFFIDSPVGGPLAICRTKQEMSNSTFGHFVINNQAADGSGEWLPHPLPWPAVVGYMSLAILNNSNPAASYFNDSLKTIEYSEVFSPSGAGPWSTPQIAALNGNYPSLCVLSSGQPAIFYVDTLTGQLLFTRYDG